MYVLSASAQAAGRNKKAFQIRRLAYGRKCCHMCEETHMYGSIFGKRVLPIHFHCNELKNIQQTTSCTVDYENTQMIFNI